MNPRLLNAVRAQGMLASNLRAVPRIGLVTDYDASTYSARVSIQPEAIETGYLPIFSPWVGSQWGFFAPPSTGNAVWVLFQENEPGAGLILGSYFNDQDIPLAVPQGEFWLQHANGSLLKFLNNGDVQMITNRDLNVMVGRDVNATVANNANLTVGATITSSATQWNHTGPVKITGTLLVSKQITGQLGLQITGLHPTTGYGGSFDSPIYGNSTITMLGDGSFAGLTMQTHRHQGVTTGGSNSGTAV